MAKQLKITLKKSIIGRNQRQRKTIEALGLKKIGQTVVPVSYTHLDVYKRQICTCFIQKG